MTDISIFVHMDCEDLPELIRFYRSIFYHNQYRMNEFGRRAYFRDFIANATVIIGKEYGYGNLYEKQFGQNYVVMLMNRKKKNFDIGTAYLSPKDKYDDDFGRFLAFARMIDLINDGIPYSSCVVFLNEVMPEFFD